MQLLPSYATTRQVLTSAAELPFGESCTEAQIQEFRRTVIALRQQCSDPPLNQTGRRTTVRRPDSEKVRQSEGPTVRRSDSKKIPLSVHPGFRGLLYLILPIPCRNQTFYNMYSACIERLLARNMFSSLCGKGVQVLLEIIYCLDICWIDRQKNKKVDCILEELTMSTWQFFAHNK